jgi:hypothetical protein
VTVIHVEGTHVDPPANPKKDGDYYDRCPSDGCLEVDAVHRSEGSQTGAREGVHDWSIFNAGVRDGGCGYTWTRTSSTGVDRDHHLGRESRWRTRSAGAERFLSAPSDSYRDNYDRIFRKGEHAEQPDAGT